jgi:hypothetical protein
VKDIPARMNFDANYVFIARLQGVSGEIAHRMRQTERAGSAVHITRFAVSGGGPNASAGRWNREEDPVQSFA